MRHVILTRFAVPRNQPDTRDLYRSEAWLESRHRLLRRFFVPSVARLEVPVILLCGGEVAAQVEALVSDLPWVRVEVQEDWHAGWRGEPDQVVTRLDSDDAVHAGWLQAVESAPESARICISKEFLRWDLDADRLHRYRRREPSPLAAFRGGVNPYEVDHKHLERLDGVHRLKGPYLLQVVHGGNVSNHRPKAWRIDRRVAKGRLTDFGIDPRSRGRDGGRVRA